MSGVGEPPSVEQLSVSVSPSEQQQMNGIFRIKADAKYYFASSTCGHGGAGGDDGGPGPHQHRH